LIRQIITAVLISVVIFDSEISCQEALTGMFSNLAASVGDILQLMS
jgi:hypothetical protein